jgi:hypothetical protein
MRAGRRRSAAASGFGPGIVMTRPWSSTPVSRVCTPKSIPAAEPGRAWRCGTGCSTSMVKDTNQRCAVRDTEADKMCRPRLDPAGELASGLVGADHAEARQGDGGPGAANRPLWRTRTYPGTGRAS